MLLRRPKYRRFSYEPRFYNPDQDRAEKFRRRMRHEREAHRKPRRSVIIWGVVLILVLYAYLYLSGVMR
ncbi:MAG TPA: hypothetical protein VNN76_00450 [Bacteroidota bacterium]|nr:hypothetical protein [Bacteroidota bacterium]